MPDLLKKAKKIIFILVVIPVFLSSNAFSANEDYTALPPFLSAAVKPNVLLVMDYSGSMQAPANYPSNHRGYYDSGGFWIYDEGWHYHSGNSLVGYYGDLSVEYNDSQTYYGYFDSNSYYEYNDSHDFWEKSGYSGTGVGNLDANPPVLHGNFLNFLVMSRVDVALKALIGGKAECPEGVDYCELRPQGSRRWVDVSDTGGTRIARFHIRPENYDSGNYTDKDILISVDPDTDSSIGRCTDLVARVKIDAEERAGIVQKNADQVRFGFMAYANGTNDTAEEGLIKYGVHEDNVDDLISALEETVPYYGTHTGHAMREAYRYLTQDDDMHSYNDDYYDPETAIDPYYEEKEDGELQPAWCRKSHVVLISDGVWSGIDPDYWAHELHTEDLRETDDGGDDDKFPGEQNADVYSLFTFSDDSQGEQSMKAVAAFGNYEDVDGCSDGTPYGLDVDDDSKNVDFDDSDFACNPSDSAGDTCCREWDEDGDGAPDAYYNASNGEEMAVALSKIFGTIRQGTSSGTSVTAITSKSTSGSAVTQAVFYPEKEFDDGRRVVWTGNVFSDWYLNAYIESSLVQNIREDTDGDYILDVDGDRILEYVIEDDSLEVQAFNSGTDGEKSSDTPAQIYDSIEDVAHLLNYGENLKDRSAGSRTIYGAAEDGTRSLFTTGNREEFDEYLGTDADEFPECLIDSGDIQYEDLIRFVRGEHVDGCRSRDADNSDSVWKLGDIISSSPTVVNYGDYRMIFTGSNDGMLHAFRLGYMKNRGNKETPIQISDSYETTDTDMVGKEEWAFIPKDAMPYLRYMADPNYEHVYTVDQKPYVIDTGEKVILIGGMRLGGACGNGPVSPPSDTDPDGRSAYFALNITDPQNPKYLWSYAPEGLGFTYSGPAYIKREDSSGDLRHYALFASGPTDYDGTSTQNLQFFVVDLLSGNELDVYGDTPNELNLSYAFGGRLFTNGLDVNDDGQTDFVLIGYSERDNANASYADTGGGIIKIYTGDSDPGEWKYDKTFFTTSISNPVTGPIVAMDCFPEYIDFPFIYFGTGRYFISDDDTGNNPNYLYGVPFTYDENNDGQSINSANNLSDLGCSELQNINSNPNQGAWKIELNQKQGNFLRERCYSRPSTSDYNIVFFDTAMPTDVVCECGGRSRSWAINCATGTGLGTNICGDGTYTVTDIPFEYLSQLSGGDIQQRHRSDFAEEGSGASSSSPGVPGDEGGVPLFPPSPTSGVDYWKQW